MKLFFYVLFFLFAESAFSNADINPDEELMHRKLRLLNDVFDKIPKEELFDLLITEEKKDLILKLTEAGISKEKNGPSHYLSREPRQLTEEEKKLDVHTRIAQRYVGALPSQAVDLIFYFANHEYCKKII